MPTLKEAKMPRAFFSYMGRRFHLDAIERKTAEVTVGEYYDWTTIVNMVHSGHWQVIIGDVTLTETQQVS